jgi:hypothetical protein
MGDAPDVLVVSGGFVDIIDHVSPGTIMPRTAGMFLPTAINIILNDIDRIFDGWSSYPTSGTLIRGEMENPDRKFNNGHPPRSVRQHAHGLARANERRIYDNG